MKTLAYIRKVDGEIEDREKLEKWFSKLLDKIPNGEHVVEINPTDRTDKQNKFYWVVLGIIAKRFGLSPDSLHRHFKSEWLPCEEYLVLVKKKRKDSTRKTIEDEMTEYINKIIQFAAEQQIIIPDPEEYKHMK